MKTDPPGGYHGQYLRVNVTLGEGTFVPLAEETLRHFIGGSGLGTWLLLAENKADIDPLSFAAPLAFVFSPLVASPLTTSAKFAVVAKSPLTHRLNDSLASSGFAIAGKRSGADALIITGKAARPSILVIDNGEVRLEAADSLWGLSCPAAEQKLNDTFPKGFQFAVIGPAGEAQVPYATISHSGRHAGRGGSGAVLGSKYIKAIAVRGDRQTPWFDSPGLVALAKELSRKSFGPATAKYRELGTAANLLVFNRLQTLPTRNFQEGSFAGAEDLSPQALETTRQRTRAYCAACTIGCEHLYAVKHAGEERETAVRLEYENLFALGPMCGVGDADTVLRASQKCDELGLDTISAGGTIAFAMECAERGLVDAPWLRMGDGKALLRAIDLITPRQGVGELLALGSRRMAEAIGQNSADFAPHVKGLEMPGYEPRGMQTMALGMAVASRGADHNRSGAYEADFSERHDRLQLTPASAAAAIETEDRAALLDSLILCKFLRGVFADFCEESAEMLNRVTGWNTSPGELRQTARRIVTAKKLFNIKAGWNPAEDTLPRRILETSPQNVPAARLTAAQLQAAIEAYNLQRGWTSAGWLPDQLLAELHLKIPS